MTTEEALKVLTKHGFVYEGWRTPDEVWMAAWRWAKGEEWWEEFLMGTYYFEGLVEAVGSPDFLVELATFLEGRSRGHDEPKP